MILNTWNHLLGITNICDLLPICTDVNYDHLLGRNPYVSKRPKRQRHTFPLALLSSTLVGVLLALVERIGKNKTARTRDISTQRSWDCAHTRREVERGLRDNGGNLGGGCERREPFAVTPSIAPPPTIEIAMLDIVIWR